MLKIKYILAILFILTGSKILASNANIDVIVLLSSKCGGENPMANAVSQVAAKRQSESSPDNQFEYVEYDICSSQGDEASEFRILSEVIVDLMLSSEWRKLGNDIENRVKAILVYLPRELFEHAVKLIKFTDIQVYQLASYEYDQTVSGWQQSLTPLSVESSIIVLLQKFGWRNVLIIELQRVPSLKIDEVVYHSKRKTIRYLVPLPFVKDVLIFEKLKKEF